MPEPVVYHLTNHSAKSGPEDLGLFLIPMHALLALAELLDTTPGALARDFEKKGPEVWTFRSTNYKIKAREVH